MNKRKLSIFEQRIMIKSFEYVLLSGLVSLTLMTLFFYTTQSNLVEQFSTLIKLYVDFGVLIILSILIISFGVGFVIFTIQRDRFFVQSKIGNEHSCFKIEEANQLNKTYNNKLAEVLTFKERCEDLKISLQKKEQDSKQSYVDYKNTIGNKQKLTTELLLLQEFYDKVSDKLSSLIWITDYYGITLYKNQLLNRQIQSSGEMESIFEILNITEDQFELFRKRNFNHILLHLKDGSSVSGRNIRIFDNESMKYILFMSETSNQEKVMNRSYLKKSRDLHFINEISKIISGQITVDTTLQDAIEKIAFLGNFDSCSIRLLNDQSMLELKALSGYSHDFVLDKQVNTAHSHLGYAFNENRILMINHFSDMLFDDRAVKAILETNRKIAYIPLTNYNKTMGIMAILSDYDFDSESLILLESISINVTIALEKILLYEQLKTNYFKTVEAFVTASEIKSERFSGHSRRVAQLCKILAEMLYLDTSEVDKIYMAGLLHDVGKLAFSEHSSDYYEDFDNHGAIGRKMVEGVGLSEDVLLGIEQHHFDFKISNPTSQMVKEQSYYAQIIRIANDFDLYMYEDSTDKHNPNFVNDMNLFVGKAYSPQFMRIIEELINRKDSALYKLYSGGAWHEK